MIPTGYRCHSCGSQTGFPSESPVPSEAAPPRYTVKEICDDYLQIRSTGGQKGLIQKYDLKVEWGDSLLEALMDLYANQFRRAEAAQPSEAVSSERKIDGKFNIRGGQIVNAVSGEVIPEDEPLFLLRGRDPNALVAINAYQGACEGECNELHMAGIQQIREKFCQFAAYYPERMKQPGITRHLKLEREAVSSTAAPEEKK